MSAEIEFNTPTVYLNHRGQSFWQLFYRSMHLLCPGLSDSAV